MIRTHEAGRVACRRRGRGTRGARGLGRLAPRPWRSHFHRPARRVRCRAVRPARRHRQRAAQRVLPARRRRGEHATGRQRESRPGDRRGRGDRQLVRRAVHQRRRCHSRSTRTPPTSARSGDCSTATSTCAASRWLTRSGCGRGSPRRHAGSWTRATSSTSRPRTSPARRRKAPATSWCRYGCSPAAGTRFRSRRSCSSSC